MRFTELVGNCEENVRNVDLEEYNTGVCEEFGLYTFTQISMVGTLLNRSAQFSCIIPIIRVGHQHFTDDILIKHK